MGKLSPMKRVRLKKKQPAIESEGLTQGALSPKLIESFCDLLRRGLPADGVCDYLRITKTSFWDWRRKGERYVEDGGSQPEHALFGEFVVKIRQAMAEYRLDRVDAMHRLRSQWVRELAILERRDRASFGRREPQGGTEEDFNADEKFL